ncbi:MAG: hypothetical protein Ct9H300mP18_05570 [Candidatus Neomarinimicrobiota bacterium]|nr:MAG: hypothetical protein Ct9H300mP18_05570 [Candidatus Neomarinimicrobiota bacterium]
MNIAKEVATRSTCDRKHVGAVIVRRKTILSTGYNGSIKGLDHCDEVGHEMENTHCVRTIHAEANAIVKQHVMEFVLRIAKFLLRLPLAMIVLK